MKGRADTRDVEAFEKVPRFCQVDGEVHARILGRQEDAVRLISRPEADGSCLEETGRFNLETRLACRCQRRRALQI
jgi:hypothetical protein